MSEARQEDKKQHHRPWLALGCIAFILLVALIWLVGFHDDPKPDDSRMIPQWSERDPATNPLIVFCHEIERSPAKQYSELPRDMTAKLNAGDAQLAREFLTRQSATLAAFGKIKQTDPTTWLWPDGEAMTNPNYSADYLSICTTAARVVLLKARVLAMEGKHDEAMHLSLDVAKLGEGMQGAEGSLIHLLTANTIQALGEGQCVTLATSQNFTRAHLVQTLDELSAMNGPRREDLRFTLQAEYRFFLHVLDLCKQGNGTADTDKVPKFLLKRHRTTNMRLNRDLPILEGLDQGWREGFTTALLADGAFMELVAKRRSIGFFLDSNLLGKISFIISSTPAAVILGHHMQASAAREQRKVLLALRLYEMDHGNLPSSLETLVPTYLPAVPEDIFTGRPMLWDAESRIVYSVGKNQKDDGGKINEERPNKGPDFGRAYPWAATPSTSPAHE